MDPSTYFCIIFQYQFQDAAVEREVEVMLEVVYALRSLQGMLGTKRGQAKGKGRQHKCINTFHHASLTH